jgi:hypothetical protein
MPFHGSTDDVRERLKAQIKKDTEVEDILRTAEAVKAKWVAPLEGGEKETNGLIYGLVQSGKTGVLLTAAAMGFDVGYRTVLVLTTDIDPLYLQTLRRVQEALPQIDIISKQDFKDWESFCNRIRRGNCAIVCSKNASLLRTLVENFKKGKLRGLPTLIIDDEADQASLNTKASKQEHDPSTINALIAQLRAFFGRNTYLQVTATPQALFLQPKKHVFRPKFTVLSNPGSDYVGGDDFFREESVITKEFPLDHLEHLSAGGSAASSTELPSSLVESLDHFMIGATFKRLSDAQQHYAYLCHVSIRRDDHEHIVAMLRRYKDDLAAKLAAGHEPTKARLRKSFEKLGATHPPLAGADFDDIVARIGRYAVGVHIKLVNGQTDEDVTLERPYNLFVGGNKLGRGVTIANLLVSYYGRHPKQPQADTVLQHARMYGYRRNDLGLLRLFLPQELLRIFRSIHRMETSLRKLIAANPAEEFRPLYVEDNLKPTRKTVLAPGSLGIYSAGSLYNPSQILRTAAIEPNVRKLDKLTEDIPDKKFKVVKVNEAIEMIQLCIPDETKSEGVWDVEAIAASLHELRTIIGKDSVRVYVDRDRNLNADRRETQGNLSGGEITAVPGDLPRLFLLRTKAGGASISAWWPEMHFPEGAYAFAFAV